MRFKRLSWLTLIVFLFTVVMPLVSAAPAMAATNVIDDVVKEIGNVYGYLENEDKIAIKEARGNLNNLDTGWIQAQPLFTDEVKQKFNLEGKSEDEAKQEILKFVKALGALTYSSDTTKLKATLTGFKEDNKQLFQTLFGGEISVDDLYSFLMKTQSNMLVKLKQQPDLLQKSNEELLKAMPDLIVGAMRYVIDNEGYTKFSGKLSEIGWSPEKLVEQQTKLAEQVDPDNQAELALAKAYVRSKVKAHCADIPAGQYTSIKNTGTIFLPSPNKVIYCKAEAFNKDVTSLVTWKSSHPNIVELDQNHDNGKTVKLTAKSAGVATITAYREGATAANDWILRFTVNVNSGGGGGGGGGGSTFTGTTVTTSGGTVTGSGATIEIPANAMSGSFKVKIEIVSNTSNLPMAENLVSDVVEITKDKSGKFDKPVTITLTYDKSKVDLSKQKISLYWLDGQIWRELDNIQIDEVNGKISGEIDHFTKFAVLATDIDKATFPDIVGHWAEANIEALVNAGVITGYPDGTFKPNKTITRAEFATAVVKAFNLAPKSGKVFNDTANHWAKDYIATAAAYGYVSGYNDTTFGPNDLITREQMALLIVNATGLTEANNAKTFVDEANISDWAKDGVAIASGNNLITGYPDNTFKPKGNATRAEAVTILLNALTLE